MNKHSSGGMDHFLDALEPRVLLSSSYTYQDFADLAGPVAPRVFADGSRGPAVFVGDVNNDGVQDLLVGNAGVTTSGGNPVDASGATLYSGSTGQVIRTHSVAEPRYGWNVAALGDVDHDGVPDYAIGSGPDTGLAKAYVISGATGNALFTVQGNSATGGATVSQAGDVNNDNHADFLVGYIGENRAVLYSGADGTMIRQFVGDSGQGETLMGIGLGGGTDFNGDTTPDVVVAARLGTHAGGPSDPYGLRIHVYSGADGSEINTIDSDQAVPTGVTTAQPIRFDTSADFNNDGVNEIVYGAGNLVKVFDANDDSQPVQIHAVQDGSAGSAVVIGDINGDGTPDIAVGLPLATSTTLSGSVGAVSVYSGLNGARLSRLQDTRFTSAGARIGVSIAYGGDLDGDGLADLIAVGDQGNGAGRIFSYSGLSLVPPTPLGVATDASGNLVAWGVVRNRGFIIRNNMLSLVSSLSGFTPGDRIIAYSTTQDGGAYILGASDNVGSNPFVWRSGSNFTNGARTNIAGFTEVGGPTGTYTSMLGTDINSSGTVLVHRLRDGTVVNAWEFDPNAHTMTYLFDGSPIAINSAGHALGITNDATGTIFWTPGSTQTIAGFLPSDFNDSDIVVGRAQRPGDAGLMAYTWQNGTFTAIPGMADSQDFTPTFINNAGIVAGTYRVTSTFGISTFIWTPGDSSSVDARVATDINDPTSFNTASNFTVHGLTGDGRIVGSTPANGTSFILSAYTEDGPYTVGANSIISSSPLPTGGMFVTTTNAAGEVIAFYRTDLTSPWHRLDLSAVAGAPRLLGDTVTWYDAQEQTQYIAAASSAGLILMRQGGNGSWTVRNLTTEIQGSEAIVTSMVVLQPQSGYTIVGGLTAGGDLVIYGQTASTNGQGQLVWGYDNLFNSVIRANSLPVPNFDVANRGRLIAYETSWDGLNIVGSGAGGQPIAIWTAPGITGWRMSNLSDSTTNPAGHSGFTHLTAYITSWGGINIASGSNLNVLWWVPGFEGEWRVDSLRASANGPLLQPDTLTAYFAPWGGLNVAGLDEQNRLVIYWWTPETNAWRAAPIGANLGAGKPTPTGNLSSLATPNASLNVFARTMAGDLLNYTWNPQANAWSVTDVTLVATA